MRRPASGEVKSSRYHHPMSSPPDPLRHPRVDALLRAARGRLDAIDADLLLAHVLDRSRTWLFAHGDAQVDPAQVERFDALVARREAGEPVAHLTGRRGFWRFDLAVSPATLIPRPETERLVELALERLPERTPLRLADLGTGSGAIALALASERPRAQVIATDASGSALGVARANADALGLRNIEFRCGDWCAPLGDEVFDLVASNPPYIASADPHLARGDLRFEPDSALASGEDGLDAIRVLARDVPRHLRPGGWLLLEHGWEQGGAVRALLEAAGFTETGTVQDLEGRDRITLGRV
jgi:release factor glutamine methyltransferase